MSAALRWGDLPIIRDTESGIAAIEREQMTKPRPLDVEGPPRYQPPTDYTPSGNSLFDAKDEFAVDSTSVHTIHLLQYCQQMGSLIEDAHHQREQLKSGEASSASSLPPPPPIPIWQPPKKKHSVLKPFAFLPDEEDSLFVQGISKCLPSSVDETTCKLLLRRSVAVVFACAGFDSCNQSVLDTLTEVCEEYYRQMLSLLRAAVDNKNYHGGSGFPDAITRVFYEMGIGKLSSIYDFYQNRVVGYHDRLLQKCIDMRDEYEQLQNPRLFSSNDERTASKSRDDSMSAVIHFPSADETEETGDGEQMDQLEGLGLEMSASQESTSTLEDGNNKWKSESANSKQEHVKNEDRIYSSDSGMSSSQLQADSRRSSISGNVVSPPGNFHLQPPLKKFKK